MHKCNYSHAKVKIQFLERVQVVHYSRILGNKRLITCKQWSLSSIKVLLLSVNLNVYTLIISWLNTQWRYHLLFRTGFTTSWVQNVNFTKFWDSEIPQKSGVFGQWVLTRGVLKTGVVHNHINALLNYLSCIFLDIESTCVTYCGYM